MEVKNFYQMLQIIKINLEAPTTRLGSSSNDVQT